ncbi:unnamed protein product [Ectocarpus sp. 8 AP-2014]
MEGRAPYSGGSVQAGGAAEPITEVRYFPLRLLFDLPLLLSLTLPPWLLPIVRSLTRG